MRDARHSRLSRNYRAGSSYSGHPCLCWVLPGDRPRTSGANNSTSIGVVSVNTVTEHSPDRWGEARQGGRYLFGALFALHLTYFGVSLSMIVPSVRPTSRSLALEGTPLPRPSSAKADRLDGACFGSATFVMRSTLQRW